MTLFFILLSYFARSTHATRNKWMGMLNISIFPATDTEIIKRRLSFLNIGKNICTN